VTLVRSQCAHCRAELDAVERVVALSPAGAKVASVTEAQLACEILGLTIELMHTDCYLDFVAPGVTTTELSVVNPKSWHLPA
jgi:hypothetical protein